MIYFFKDDYFSNFDHMYNENGNNGKFSQLYGQKDFSGPRQL